MKLTISALKKAIREELLENLEEEQDQDYNFISSDIVSRLESEDDVSQAITSFLKDNPNSTERDVALALKAFPIHNTGLSEIVNKRTV